MLRILCFIDQHHNGMFMGRVHDPVDLSFFIVGIPMVSMTQKICLRCIEEITVQTRTRFHSETGLPLKGLPRLRVWSTIHRLHR